MTKEQALLLIKIKDKYPDSWFNAKNVNGKVKDLEALKSKGLLKSSKPPHSGPTNWRLV